MTRTHCRFAEAVPSTLPGSPSLALTEDHPVKQDFIPSFSSSPHPIPSHRQSLTLREKEPKRRGHKTIESIRLMISSIIHSNTATSPELPAPGAPVAVAKGHPCPCPQGSAGLGWPQPRLGSRPSLGKSSAHPEPGAPTPPTRPGPWH